MLLTSIQQLDEDLLLDNADKLFKICLQVSNFNIDAGLPSKWQVGHWCN